MAHFVLDQTFDGFDRIGRFSLKRGARTLGCAFQSPVSFYHTFSVSFGAETRRRFARAFGLGRSRKRV